MVQVGDSIRTKVEIGAGDGCEMPRYLIARIGDVLQVTSTECRLGEGTVSVRHHGYQGDHPGFYLCRHEYTLLKCACVNQYDSRLDPCWTVPVNHNQGVCVTCGHDTTCHKHTDRFKDSHHRWVEVTDWVFKRSRCTRCGVTVQDISEMVRATVEGCSAGAEETTNSQVNNNE